MADGMGSVTEATMKGALIYAFNNRSIDYFAQACWCADRVKAYTGLPVTIVTDPDSHRDRITDHSVIYSQPEMGGGRIYNPSQDSRSETWINANRYQSYQLSPYDQTIVIDSDYIVCSDQLTRLFDTELELAVMKDVYDVTGRSDFDPYRWISEKKTLHHYWATVIYFRKGQLAQDFFDIMTMVKQNYLHYANLYGFRSTPFRNDFAASIAITAVYGHVPESVPTIPWKMANVFSDVEILDHDQDRFDLTYSVGADKSPRRVRIQSQDFHFMNKKNLQNIYAD